MIFFCYFYRQPMSIHVFSCHVWCKKFSKYGKVPSWFYQHILRIEDGDFRLSVRSSVNLKRILKKILFYVFLHIQSHSDLRNPPFAFYYRCTNFESICAWCSKPLNEDLKKRLASKRKLIQRFNEIVVNMVVCYETREVKTGGLYSVW